MVEKYLKCKKSNNVLQTDMKNKNLTVNQVALPLLAAVFLVYFDNNFPSPVLASIARDLDIDLALAGNLVAVYSIATALGSILFGPVSDVRGRRFMLSTSLLAFSLFTILCGMAQSYLQMLALRAACGLAGGVLVSNAYAYATDYCLSKGEAQRLTGVMGTITSGIFLAIVIGVPAGLFAASLGTWRSAFIAAGAIALLLLIAIIRLPSIAAGTSQSSYLKELVGYFALMKKPGLGLPLLIFFVQLIPTAFPVYAPTWIILNGYNLQVIAVIYMITGVVSTATAMLSGRVAAETGTKRLLIGSNLVMAAAVLLVGLTPFQLIWSTALFTTYSMCMAARMAQMQAYALQRVDAAQRGRYSALISFWMQLGATAGVAATASGLSHFDLSLDRGGMTAIAIICCVLLLGTAVLCMRLPYQGEVADAGR